MSAPHMNRRAVLGAAMVAPIAASASALSTDLHETAAWDRALAVYRTACAKHDVAASAFSRCEERYFASRGEEPARPELSPLDTTMSISDMAAGINAEWTQKWAAYDRARKAWQDADDADRERLTGDAARACNLALDERTAALDALAEMSAPTIGHIVQKLDLLAREFGEIDATRLAAVLGDLRRLDREARA